MTIHCFIDSLENSKCSSPNVEAIEELYNTEFPPELTSIISKMNETLFFEGVDFARLLSFQEVLDANDDLNVDFIGIKIVPLIDLGDNDYLSYDLKNKRWCKFNIVDEISFSIKDKLQDYFD